MKSNFKRASLSTKITNLICHQDEYVDPDNYGGGGDYGGYNDYDGGGDDFDYDDGGMDFGGGLDF